VLLVDDLSTPIEAIRAYMVSQVGLSGRRIYRERFGFERIVCATHAALGRRFPILLNRHVEFLKVRNLVVVAA
jgi:hypothetical protein